jgi:hypothetical protein
MLPRTRDDGLLRRFAPLRKRFAFVAANDGDTHAGNSYPTALSAAIVFCTAGRAIIRV